MKFLQLTLMLGLLSAGGLSDALAQGSPGEKDLTAENSRAIRLVGEGKLDEAIEIWNRLLVEAPANARPAIQKNLGRAQQTTGRLNLAWYHLDQALKHKKDDAKLQAWRGEAEDELKKAGRCPVRFSAGAAPDSLVVDGVDVPIPPQELTWWVGNGPHVAKATRKGRKPVFKQFDITCPAAGTVTLGLDPEPGPATLELEGLPEGAEVLVNKTRVATKAGIARIKLKRRGKYTLTVRKKGFEEFRQPLTLGPGDKVKVPVAMKPASTAGPGPGVGTSATGGSDTWKYVMLGGGVACLVGGTVTYLVAGGNQSDLDDEYEKLYPGPMSQEEADKANNAYDARRDDEVAPWVTSSWVLWGVGGAATAASIIFLSIDDKSGSTTALRPLLGPGVTGVTVNWGW